LPEFKSGSAVKLEALHGEVFCLCEAPWVFIEVKPYGSGICLSFGRQARASWDKNIHVLPLEQYITNYNTK
jgi:hypothetical protein